MESGVMTDWLEEARKGMATIKIVGIFRPILQSAIEAVTANGAKSS